MKKIVFLSIVSLALFVSTNAQLIGISSEYKPKKFKPAAESGGIKFGIKAGANFADLGGDDAEGFDMKVGFHGGAIVNIPIAETFAFNPELYFSAEGAKIEELDAKLALGYIRLALMFQYVTSSGFFAELGPNLGFLMSAKAKNDDEEEDIKDSFKGIDFALGVGIGYKLKSGLGFGARYNFGLSNIIDEDDADVKTSCINLGLFYMLGGNKK